MSCDSPIIVKGYGWLGFWVMLGLVAIAASVVVAASQTPVPVETPTHQHEGFAPAGHRHESGCKCPEVEAFDPGKSLRQVVGYTGVCRVEYLSDGQWVTVPTLEMTR